MVDKLYLIHHDPDRTDVALKAILNDARKVFSNTELAAETLVYEVEKKSYLRGKKNC
jgi:hypothetical protein